MYRFTDILKQRRSIRKYKPQSVPMDIVRDILETATYAPSAHNAQPWRFIILTENGQKKAMANAMANVWLAELERDKVPENERWTTVNRSVVRFTAAPVLVVACLTLEGMDMYPDVERQQTERDLAVQSLAAAIQTLLLAAHVNGLGACWYCAPLFCKDAVREALKIPKDVAPQALITMGYANETPKLPGRRSFEHCVYMENWGIPFSNNQTRNQCEKP
jgi:coenzyme F420-0:L-glutamate ligase / coenzyme F420-1:gamma-L-glutamate ligase